MVNFSVYNMTIPKIKEYRIHGCEIPTADNPQPQIFVATIYDRNHVLARTRFTRLLDKKYKIKATKAMILRCEQIPEPEVLEVRNYGVDYVYQSKRDFHNCYMETRAVSRCGAVQAIAAECKKQYSVEYPEIDIVNVRELAYDELRRLRSIEFSVESLEFPVFTKIINTKKNLVPVDYNLSD
jgi:large subunit ribosomal protein L18Ae